MSRIIVDPTTEAQLANVCQTSELCNVGGRVLGHFIPALDLSKYEGLEPQIGEEELRRRERQGGGRPLTEILADLEKKE